jgi:mucin-19
VVSKKPLVFALAVGCFLPVVGSSGVSAADSCTIGSADQLVALTTNRQCWDTGDVVTLAADIDLNGVPLTSTIGVNGQPFAATFDGAGKSIVGLRMDSSSAIQYGLFGVVTGTVRNLRVSGSVTGGDRVGLLVGELDGGVVDRVTYDGSVGGRQLVGGLIGYAHEPTARVSAIRSTAGKTISVVAGNSSGSDAQQVGGVVGRLSNAAVLSDVDVSGVVVRATRTSTGDISTSCVAGYVDSSSVSSIKVSNCDNQAVGGDGVGAAVGWAANGSSVADVTVIGARISGPFRVGGAVGHLVDSSARRLSVTGSTITTTDGYAGGALGVAWNVVGRGAYSMVVEDVSVTTSSVSGTEFVGGSVGVFVQSSGRRIGSTSVTVTGTASVGGAFGLVRDSDVEDSFGRGNAVSGSSSVGGFVGTLDSPGGYATRITRSFADAGAVRSTSGSHTGGLVGVVLDASVAFSSARTLNVVSTGDATGGLVGGGFGVAVSDSYATGSVSGPSNVGGIAGQIGPGAIPNQVTRTASGVRVTSPVRPSGFVGIAEGLTISGSHWDTSVNLRGGATVGVGNGNVANPAGLKSATTAKLRSRSTYAGWTFDSRLRGFDPDGRVWGICSAINGGRPFLLWEYPTSTPTRNRTCRALASSRPL